MLHTVKDSIRYQPSNSAERIIFLSVIAALLLYTGVFLIPGFFLHHLITTPLSFVTTEDHHYGIVYGSALRMVLGHSPADLQINYGLIFTLSAAFLAKFFAIETFGGWI